MTPAPAPAAVGRAAVEVEVEEAVEVEVEVEEAVEADRISYLVPPPWCQGPVERWYRYHHPQ
jgi:hypothetical protein